MDSQRFFKMLKIDKEIKELISDRNQLLRLYESGNVYETNSYIDDIARKYPLETTIYHTTHFMPPMNLQDRARNCMDFLKGLIWAKSVELVSESSKEINNA